MNRTESNYLSYSVGILKTPDSWPEAANLIAKNFPLINYIKRHAIKLNWLGIDDEIVLPPGVRVRDIYNDFKWNTVNIQLELRDNPLIPPCVYNLSLTETFQRFPPTILILVLKQELCVAYKEMVSYQKEWLANHDPSTEVTELNLGRRYVPILNGGEQREGYRVNKKGSQNNWDFPEYFVNEQERKKLKKILEDLTLIKDSELDRFENL